MGKLIEDNANLSEKFAESEVYRRKFLEKNQELEKKLKLTTNEKTTLEVIICIKLKIIIGGIGKIKEKSCRFDGS